MALLDHYIQRGHYIKELLALDEYEKLFYMASMKKANEEQEELIKTLKLKP